MLKLRRALFVLFSTLYVILCPLTILHALGYAVQPGSEQRLVKTGLIHLSTAPPGASVYLGNRRYTQTTPATLRGLLPGTYDVKMVLKDRQPWVQTIPVEAEKATVLEHVLLLPSSWKEDVLLPDAFEALIPMPASRFFLVMRGPNVEDLVVYDWKEARAWPLVPKNSLFHGMRVLDTRTVRESPAALLHVASERGERWLWVELRRKEARVEDLTSLVMERPDHVEWDPADRKHLFVVSHGDVNRLDILAKAIYPKIAESLRGLGVFRRFLYVVSPAGLLQRRDHEGNGAELLADLSRVGDGLVDGAGWFDIRMVSDDLGLLMGDRGQVLVNMPPYRLTDRGVSGVEWSPQTERLLLWGRERIGMVELSGLHTDNEDLDALPAITWVYSRGRDIRQASWVFSGSHVLFRDGDRVQLLGLETAGRPQLSEVVTVKSGSAVAYSDESGRLYFLDRGTGALTSIEILPRREALFLPFPEGSDTRKRLEFQGL